jgi:rubrerythrin
MKIEGISASSYNTYDQCQWKWFLSYSLGIEDASGGAAILGNVCHDVFETMSIASIEKKSPKHKDFDLKHQWDKWFNEYKEKNEEIFKTIKDDKIRKIYKGAQNLLEGKYKDYTPINPNTICAEQYFKISIKEDRFKIPDHIRSNDDQTHFSIRGFIDRIDKIDDETLEIIDYKTGSRASFMSDSKDKKDGETLRDDIQPRMYHLASKVLYPEIKNFLITFIYTTDGGPITTPMCDEDISDTKEMIYNRYMHVLNNTNPQQNKSWRCRFCAFDKSKTNLCDQLYDEKQSMGQQGLEFLQLKYSIMNENKKR